MLCDDNNNSSSSGLFCGVITPHLISIFEKQIKLSKNKIFSLHQCDLIGLFLKYKDFKFLYKWTKYLGTFGANVKIGTFCVNCCTRYCWGTLWRKLGLFLFQHLVTLLFIPVYPSQAIAIWLAYSDKLDTRLLSGLDHLPQDNMSSDGGVAKWLSRSYEEA